MAETRVEKFKAYREEIQNSFSDSDLTTMKKTSDRVNKLLVNQEGVPTKSQSLSIDEMINAYEIYDKGVTNETSPLLKKVKQNRIYLSISLTICLLFVGLTILFAVLAFGGR